MESELLWNDWKVLWNARGLNFIIVFKDTSTRWLGSHSHLEVLRFWKSKRDFTMRNFLLVFVVFLIFNAPVEKQNITCSQVGRLDAYRSRYKATFKISKSTSTFIWKMEIILCDGLIAVTINALCIFCWPAFR